MISDSHRNGRALEIWQLTLSGKKILLHYEFSNLRTSEADQFCLAFTLTRHFVASQIIHRSCHAPFRIFLHYSKSNRMQKKRSIRCKETVWFSAWCLQENFYQSLPKCTASDLDGCYGYCYHLDPPCESKLSRILADQCKQNPYRDQFW